MKKKPQDEFSYMYEIEENIDNDRNLTSHTSYLASSVRWTEKTENDFSLLALI